MREKYISQWENQFNEQMKVRIEKRAKLEDAGSHPYKHGVKPTATAAELVEKYGDLAKEDKDIPFPGSGFYSVCYLDFSSDSGRRLVDGVKDVGREQVAGHNAQV